MERNSREKETAKPVKIFRTHLALTESHPHLGEPLSRELKSQAADDLAFGVHFILSASFLSSLMI